MRLVLKHAEAIYIWNFRRTNTQQMKIMQFKLHFFPNRIFYIAPQSQISISHLMFHYHKHKENGVIHPKVETVKKQTMILNN